MLEKSLHVDGGLSTGKPAADDAQVSSMHVDFHVSRTFNAPCAMQAALRHHLVQDSLTRSDCALQF